MVHRSFVAALALALLGSVVVAAPAGASVPYVNDWAFLMDGWNRSSSPVIADIDADGQNEIVFGHQDGMVRAYEGDGSLKWATAAVPTVNTGNGCNGQGGASAVDSSPAVADIDEDGTPEVIVGVGSTWVANQNGGIIVFDGKTGAKEWGSALGRDTGDVWANSGSPDGWCEGVFSTPSIGDIDGDGHLDVVFASFDFYICAVDRTGTPLSGFPVNNDDSVWSSAALFDIDGDDDMKIFIGGDSTPGGYYSHLGGVFRALDWTPGGVHAVERGGQRGLPLVACDRRHQRRWSSRGDHRNGQQLEHRVRQRSSAVWPRRRQRPQQALRLPSPRWISRARRPGVGGLYDHRFARSRRHRQ